MKKTIPYLCLGIAFCLAACSDDDDNKVTMPSTPSTLPFSLTATLPVRTTDATEAVPTLQGNWNEKSQVTAVKLASGRMQNAVWTRSTSSPDLFTGEVGTQVVNESELAIVYPAAAVTTTSNDTLTQVLTVNRQDGTPTGIQHLDYAWAKTKATVKDSVGSSACEMTPLMTIGKFRFTSNGTPLENIARITITATEGNLYASSVLLLKKGELTNPSKGNILIEQPTGYQGTTYVSFFPTEAQLHFTLVTTDHAIYETSTKGTVQLEKGKIYTSPALECTPLQPARVGDYYYSDATYSSVKDENKTCIGIVYALNDEKGNLITTQEASPYGRIVALKDNQIRVKWMNKASDVEGIPNDTTVNGKLTQGALPYYNGTVESYFTDKAEEQIHGATLDVHTGHIATWLSQGILSDFQGESHTACFKKNASTYPAGGLTTQYFTEGTSAGDWYLPAAGELALLWELYKSGVICEASKEGFRDFAEKSYWSSSEHSAGKAWYINFISGFVVPNSKNSQYATRAVARF